MMSREEIMLRADERCALAKAEDGLRGLITERTYEAF
jgi:hypothetical protein